MKKIFKSQNKSYIRPIIYLSLIVVYCIYLFILVGKDIDWSNSVLLVVPLLVILISILFLRRGSLELENNILSRRRFFKLWSINVLDIKDIMQGNMLGTRELKVLGMYHKKGLSFHTKDDNYYQFPEYITDQQELVDTLLSVNPSINFITDTTTFRDQLGWKGGTDRKLNVLLFFLALVLLAVLTISQT